VVQAEAPAVAIYQVRVIDPDDDSEISFPCLEGEYICDAADRSGQEIPFSCRSGGCLVCCGRLLEGDCEMSTDQYVLEEEDIAAGFRLLCCTSPTTDVVFLANQENHVGIE